jgi:hypothetical protein
MILSHLVAAMFVVAVSTGPFTEQSGPLSLQQKDAATRAYMRAATDCIVHSVVADARFRKDDPSANLGDLIVDAVPNCLTSVRAMIDAHDRYFGEDSGEEFFMGVYLDALPNALIKTIQKGAAEARPGAPREQAK